MNSNNSLELVQLIWERATHGRDLDPVKAACVAKWVDGMPAGTLPDCRNTSRKLAALVLSKLADLGVYADDMSVESVWPKNGSLVLNPFRGCNFGCVYCFRAPDGTEGDSRTNLTVPTRVEDDLSLVDRALRSKWRTPGKTVISLHSGSTDPFLPSTRASTHAMLLELSRRKVPDPVMIITKMPLNDSDYAILERTSNLKRILFLSYNGADGRMETMSGSAKIDKRRWDSRDRLAESRIPNLQAAHYYRPIISGWNDREADIERSLDFGEPLKMSVIGGLVPLEGLGDRARERGLPPPSFPQTVRRKHFPSELRQRILAIHRRLELDSLIIQDQSCALTVLLGRMLGGEVPNVDGERIADEVLGRQHPVCLELCSEQQLEACTRGRIVTPEALRVAAEQIGVDQRALYFDPIKRCIVTVNRLDEAQRGFFRTRFSVPVLDLSTSWSEDEVPVRSEWVEGDDV